MIRYIATRRVLAALTLVALSSDAAAQRQGDDRVLRDLATGMAALQANDIATAESHLVRATDLIAGIWGGGEDARRARQLWYAESVKSFRGEPYERMMAFFYRGLLHLRAGDLGNAQASFRLSAMQDGFAEEEQARGDVAAPILLMWVSLRAQGSFGAADEAAQQLMAIRPDIANCLRDNINLVVVVETGTAPRKVPDGLNAERLRYFQGRGFTERVAWITIADGEKQLAWPADDIFFQARTRGGRPVDAMLRGRAQFAAAAANIGGAFAELGSDLAIRGSYARAMGGSAREASSIRGVQGEHLEIAGAAIGVIAALVNPAADVRAWDNLPDAIHILPTHLPPGRHRLIVSFSTATADELPELTQVIDVDIAEGATTPLVVLVRSRHRGTRILPSGR